MEALRGGMCATYPSVNVCVDGIPLSPELGPPALDPLLLLGEEMEVRRAASKLARLSCNDARTGRWTGAGAGESGIGDMEGEG